MRHSRLFLFAMPLMAACMFISCNPQDNGPLPRGKASAEFDAAMVEYLSAVEESGQDLHSIMVLKDGEVLFEKWMSAGKPDEPHILNSVSKTFTSTAVGLAAGEGLLSIDDKVISFFPEDLPDEVSENLAAMTVRDLLTMTCGHETDPTRKVWSAEKDWAKEFLAVPVSRKPGEVYCYNSLGTYMLSAIVQKVTGEKLIDYLTPRLFEPLGITDATWSESPDGVNTGGWGLYLKTEDLAKMGQLLLQKGKWGRRQLVPKEWVEEASSRQTHCINAGLNSDMLKEMPEEYLNSSDWTQGYGYQMWRCRHNAFRADGANGQYIIVIPDKNAVVVTTAAIQDMQSELNLIWQYILPVL
ncbi:MAG: serine hydrolase [Bacteroidales bacterium]|nr:serine hydrolase [Bacteroidales bacterium]